MIKLNSDPNWWKNKVAYQIYPKSFLDTDGDGVGDLRGIINKLDYLQSLGIQILWISPMYKSPFVDQGYDISDYYSIDPLFGTMDDMDELIAEAQKRDIYIVMDLVINHCSDQHEWFQKALADPESEYRDYFYFKESKQGPPNNWRSYFGGSVWSEVPNEPDKYYLHSFHKTQPDLNWQNEEVREELYKMINWWLEKGIVGFRIDAIINIKKDLTWESLEPDREDGLVSIKTVLPRAQSIDPFLTELRDKTFAKFNAFTVGEVFDETDDEIVYFIGEDGYFSTMFDFNQTILGSSEKGWYDRTEITPEMIKESIFEAHRRIDPVGVIAPIIENHDEPRGVNFFLQNQEINDKSKKMLATILMMRRGLPFIYQGQEIGMENVTFTELEQLDDIDTINQYYVARETGLGHEESMKAIMRYSRDNARTPMQWSSEENAGFTRGEPWLEVNRNYKEINVEDQIDDPESLLSYYKNLIHLRTDSEYTDVFVEGNFEPLFEEKENILAYKRLLDEHEVILISNYQNQPTQVEIELDEYEVILNNYNEIEFNQNKLKLNPYQVVVLYK